MKTSQNLAKSIARIKLFKRHLTEWKMLLNTQAIVRHSVQDVLPGQPSLNEGNSRIDSIQRMIHLNLLNRSHYSERQQLKTRHQEEDIDLEKVLDDFEN